MLPSVWNINAGCDSKLHLFPFDPDNNTISCRWYTGTTGIHPNRAFRLDHTECIIYYHADKDEWKNRKSIIPLMLVDFNGTLTVSDAQPLSEVPVKFTTNRTSPKTSRVWESSVCQSIPTIENIYLQSDEPGEFADVETFS